MKEAWASTCSGRREKTKSASRSSNWTGDALPGGLETGSPFEWTVAVNVLASPIDSAAGSTLRPRGDRRTRRDAWGWRRWRRREGRRGCGTRRNRRTTANCRSRLRNRCENRRRNWGEGAACWSGKKARTCERASRWRPLKHGEARREAIRCSREAWSWRDNGLSGTAIAKRPSHRCSGKDRKKPACGCCRRKEQNPWRIRLGNDSDFGLGRY